jgi:hypothetical protein
MIGPTPRAIVDSSLPLSQEYVARSAGWLLASACCWSRRGWRRSAAAWLFGVSILVGQVGLAKPVAAQAVTAAAVDAAIEQGIDYLRQTQVAREGRWPDYENYQSGQTALVLLALLNCGLPPDDPTVASGLDYLKRTSPQFTYEVALQTMAFCAADPQRYATQIRRNAQWLVDSQAKTGKGKGGWGYDQMRGGTDPSNAQFGVLALWEVQRSQLGRSPEAMLMAAEYWSLRQQERPNSPHLGGWRYNDADYSGSMTCAGIASLMMAEDSLEQFDVQVVGDDLDCCVGEARESRADLGMRWMERYYQIGQNPVAGNFWLYYLYALERVGRLTGQRFIANHDWYREGCELLVKRQDKLRGFIVEGTASGSQITDTALALLFLSKGKRPIVMGRLQVASLPSSSMPRHAIQHLTGHIEQAWKKDLAWQSLSLEAATLEQLLEAPILFLSGSESLQLDADAKERLKQYVEQGGFILAEAKHGDGCSGEAFDRSFRDLMEELFETPLQKISPDHPVWYAEAPVELNSLPPDFWLYGLESCCRTSVIYSPISLSCRWEVHRPQGLAFEKLSPVLKSQCQNISLLGVNIATYATGRELKEKLDTVEVIRTSREASPPLRGMLRLPRLAHTGGAEDTPRSITNLMEVFRREISTQVVVDSPIVAIADENLEEPPLAYLSGRRRFEFSETERASLRRYLQHGGLILGDAICGSPEFTEAIHEQLSLALPGAEWKKVPADHPMLTREFQGFDIRRVSILQPGAVERGQAVQVRKYEGPPVLEFLIWEGRCVAIFSPLDLSCALESRHSTQCRGYPRADAARIGVNMLLYGLLN